VNAIDVCFVIPSLRPASGWRSLSIGAVTALTEHAGISPAFVVSEDDAGLAASLPAGAPRLVVPQTQLLSFNPRGWRAAIATWARVRRRHAQPAIVHSLEAFPTGLVGHWLARHVPCPHVLTAAGTYGVVWAERRLHRRVYARVLAHAAAILPISHGTADLMQAHFGWAMRDGALRVVTIGTDVASRVSPASALERRPADPPIVISVGAIKPRKGYAASVRAIARVQQRRPSLRYRIIGSVDQPDYLDQLRRLAVETGARVEFLTEVSDAELDRHYRDATLFLLAPEQRGLVFEGFGLVYLEAGAYGLPVVATRTGGVADAVRDGETGLLAPPGDVETLSAHVLALLEDPARAARIGQANRQWAEHLTWRRYAAEQRRIYEEILGGRP
jgi:glycosyltransferase involved in cell wall biosynthesis